MPRYKITQHLSGWKVIENSIDAKDEDDDENSSYESYSESYSASESEDEKD